MTRRRCRVDWAEVARGDLRGIVEYLLESTPDTAHRVVDRIEKRAATLGSMPRRGRVIPELARLRIREYRELQLPPYRLIYRLTSDRVLVLGLFDSRRNLEDILLDRLVRPPG